MAPNGTKIYDAETNIKIAEVEKENMVTTKIKKKPSSLWNILFWPGFLVDLGTGKMFKWDNTIINLELEPATGTEK